MDCWKITFVILNGFCPLKVVSATFLLVCFFTPNREHLTKKNVFYFTLRALLVLEIGKSNFNFSDIQMS